MLNRRGREMTTPGCQSYAVMNQHSTFASAHILKSETAACGSLYVYVKLNLF